MNALVLITCLTASHQSFTLNLKDYNVRDMAPNTLDALVTDLHSMGIALKSKPTTVEAEPILTRTIVGQKLSFSLPSGVAVVLNDVYYGSKEFELQGVATMPDGSEIALQCEKN